MAVSELRSRMTAGTNAKTRVGYAEQNPVRIANAWTETWLSPRERTPFSP